LTGKGDRGVVIPRKVKINLKKINKKNGGVRERIMSRGLRAVDGTGEVPEQHPLCPSTVLREIASEESIIA